MLSYEILEKGLALIEDPKHWGKGQRMSPLEDGGFARCATGAILGTVSDEPWSFLGALRAVESFAEAAAALDRAVPARFARSFSASLYPDDRPGKLVEAFNDCVEREHGEIIAVFQDAIRAEKARLGVDIEVPSQRGGSRCLGELLAEPARDPQ